MPSAPEASDFPTNTDCRRLRAIAGRQTRGVGVLVVIGTFLFFVVAWSQTTRSGVGADSQVADIGRPGVRQDKRERTTGGAPLFLGHVEFDWDPDRTSGTPGFGPAPRDLTIEFAAAGRGGE